MKGLTALVYGRLVVNSIKHCHIATYKYLVEMKKRLSATDPYAVININNLLYFVVVNLWHGHAINAVNVLNIL